MYLLYRHKHFIFLAGIAIIFLSVPFSYAETVKYTYDDYNRLTYVQYEKNSIEYRYDEVGNRKGMIISKGSSSAQANRPSGKNKAESVTNSNQESSADNMPSDIKTFTIIGSKGSDSASYASSVDQWDKWTHKVGERDTGKTLYGATFGNKLFVVVGGGGVILTSPEGSSWTRRTSGTTEDLKGVSFVNNIFVAAGNNGSILTSRDGKTWVSRTSGSTDKLYSIAYGKGVYVVVGESILTSADTVTWTKGSYADFEQLNSIAFGDDKFVAVGLNGVVLTSSDGLTWTGETLAGILNGVVYAGNKFVIAGVNVSVDGSGDLLTPGVVYSSTDGVLWTDRTSGDYGPLYGITYSNDAFVAAGYIALVTSPDGETWTERGPINSEDWLLCIAYGKNAYVAAGYNGIYQSGSTKGGGMTSKPKLSISPKALTLGNATVDDTLTGNIVITNTGGDGLATNIAIVTKQGTPEFMLDTPEECSALAPSESCTVTITFTPAAGSKAGAKKVRLGIVSNDPKKVIATVNISAAVVTPRISVKAATFNASSSAVGVTATSVMKISNNGGAPLAILEIDIPEMDSGEFTQTNNCTTVAPGSFCEVTVSFKPASKGNRSATLTVLSDDPQKADLKVKLTGKGK